MSEAFPWESMRFSSGVPDISHYHMRSLRFSPLSGFNGFSLMEMRFTIRGYDTVGFSLTEMRFTNLLCLRSIPIVFLIVMFLIMFNLSKLRGSVGICSLESYILFIA